MNNFERRPKEKKDPITAMEELKRGQFSVTLEEKERIVKDALASGKNPEEALREYEEKLARATSRLRRQQTEDAIKNLERDMNESFRRKSETSKE